MIEIINKLLSLLHLVGCLYYYISDARSHKDHTLTYIWEVNLFISNHPPCWCRHNSLYYVDMRYLYKRAQGSGMCYGIATRVARSKHTVIPTRRGKLHTHTHTPIRNF